MVWKKVIESIYILNVNKCIPFQNKRTYRMKINDARKETELPERGVNLESYICNSNASESENSQAVPCLSWVTTPLVELTSVWAHCTC